MPTENPGIKHTAIFTKITDHGAPCVENGFPGVAEKVAQLGSYVDPASAAARQIAVGEEGEIVYRGEVEVARAGNLAAADVSADDAVSAVYIRVADNVLGLAAQALAAGALNAGWVKFGRISERDASRNPQVLRVSLDARNTIPGDAA